LRETLKDKKKKPRRRPLPETYKKRKKDIYKKIGACGSRCGSQWVPRRLSCANKSGKSLIWANSSGLESQTTKMTQIR
jgi:predicted aconitase